MKKSLRNAKLTFEELYIVLVEIEGVLNSRPLTYVFDEMNEPLTPSQLSIGRRILSTSTDTAQRPVQADLAALTRRARFLQQTLNHFWNRWRSEYLTELREHHRVNIRANSRREIRQGDIVIVQEKKQPRQSWRLGKVERLIPVVTVKSKNGVEFRRPVQRLFPLEVTADDVDA